MLLEVKAAVLRLPQSARLGALDHKVGEDLVPQLICSKLLVLRAQGALRLLSQPVYAWSEESVWYTDAAQLRHVDSLHLQDLLG